MEEIWNKYKEEQLQTSAYMFRQNEKVYKQIFFDAFYLGEQSSLAERAENKLEHIEFETSVEDLMVGKTVYTTEKKRNENFFDYAPSYTLEEKMKRWVLIELKNPREEKTETKINRVEVIQKDKGRVYTNYNVKSCVIQEQDNGETLKIFLDYERQCKKDI